MDIQIDLGGSTDGGTPTPNRGRVDPSHRYPDQMIARIATDNDDNTYDCDKPGTNIYMSRVENISPGAIFRVGMSVLIKFFSRTRKPYISGLADFFLDSAEEAVVLQGWLNSDSAPWRDRSVVEVDGDAPTLSGTTVAYPPHFPYGIIVIPPDTEGAPEDGVLIVSTGTSAKHLAAVNLADNSIPWELDVYDSLYGSSGGEIREICFAHGKLWGLTKKGSPDEQIHLVAYTLGDLVTDTPTEANQILLFDGSGVDSSYLASVSGISKRLALGVMADDLLHAMHLMADADDESAELRIRKINPTTGALTSVTLAATVKRGDNSLPADVFSFAADGVFILSRRPNNNNPIGSANVLAVNENLAQVWQIQNSITWQEAPDYSGGDDNAYLYGYASGETLFEIGTFDGIYTAGKDLAILAGGPGSDDANYVLGFRINAKYTSIGSKSGLDWETPVDAGTILTSGGVTKFAANKTSAQVATALGGSKSAEFLYAGIDGSNLYELLVIEALTGAIVKTVDVSSEVNAQINRAWVGGSVSVDTETFDGATGTPVSHSLGDCREFFGAYRTPDSDPPSNDSEFFTASDPALPLECVNRMPTVLTGDVFTHLTVAATFVDSSTGDVDSCFCKIVPWLHIPTKSSGDYFEVRAATRFHANQENGGASLDLGAVDKTFRIDATPASPAVYITLALNDIILVNDQDLDAGDYGANGIYEVTSVGASTVALSYLSSLDGLEVGSMVLEHASGQSHLILWRLAQAALGLGTTWLPGDTVSNSSDQDWHRYKDALNTDEEYDQVLGGLGGLAHGIYVGATWSGYDMTLQLGGPQVVDRVCGTGDDIKYTISVGAGAATTFQVYDDPDDIDYTEDGSGAVIADGKLFTFTKDPNAAYTGFAGIKCRTWPGMVDVWERSPISSTQRTTEMAYHNGALIVGVYDHTGPTNHKFLKLDPDDGTTLASEVVPSLTTALAVSGGNVFATRATQSMRRID